MLSCKAYGETGYKQKRNVMKNRFKEARSDFFEMFLYISALAIFFIAFGFFVDFVDSLMGRELSYMGLFVSLIFVISNNNWGICSLITNYVFLWL